MWAICKKELRQFFSSLTGYIAIIAFLLMNGLFLFVFPDTNVFDYGYATLDKFFEMAPWILLLLIPAITMRAFSEEFRSGTYEILQTRPLGSWRIIQGKYLAALIVVALSILPTVIYVYTVGHLSTGGLDTGGILGAYIGLLALAAVFNAIGLCCSSASGNAVVAFLLAAFACFLLYSGFDAISRIPAFRSGADYYIGLLGIDFHYQRMSRGVIDTRDIVYFASMVLFFLFLTAKNLEKR